MEHHQYPPPPTPSYLTGTMSSGKKMSIPPICLRSLDFFFFFFFLAARPQTPPATGNRSNNTNQKVDLIPVSCRWLFGLAGQISTFFLLFSHAATPPSSSSHSTSPLSSQAPSAVVTLSWSEAFSTVEAARRAARTCHITLSSAAGRGEGHLSQRLWVRTPVCEGDQRPNNQRGSGTPTSAESNFLFFGDTSPFSPSDCEEDHSCLWLKKNNK